MLFLSTLVTLLIGYQLWRLRYTRSDYQHSGDKPFPKISVAFYSILLGLLVWAQVQHHRLENRLGMVATELVGRPTQVGCETFLESWIPDHVWAEGYVFHGSPKLFLRHGVCRRLTEVMDAPEPQSRFHSTAVVVLAHEAMHVRGITNEAETECAAIQRAARTAMLLGVPDAPAHELARAYWQVQYLQIRQASEISPYYSIECRAQGVLDEGLPHPPWNDKLPGD